MFRLRQGCGGQARFERGENFSDFIVLSCGVAEFSYEGMESLSEQEILEQAKARLEMLEKRKITSKQLFFIPVSYTHLTLPTIYSV